ncbi:double-strand break repair helicase AddA [Rhodopila sp.]|uniref:double-strand break repair helicase AddA n=1 Tax=Rhodopila sp. TaxID=2480087 RepID=UPI002B8A5AB7|nr:double-strand break repair helicase AddA [Rhodopila sp.]HVZ08697.1 double-strand break repair helicase AddA [Rhodopila sp.]
MTAPRIRAQQEQLRASDPAVSAFVAASAGSGKTKLLTDRLLRLMLAGAPPARIQCLTFTKAAAAEMALRLQRTLGRWVTMPQNRLEQALRDLDVAPTEAHCHAARALFAKVLDLPGGMRIGTIHAFSQSLLRRFPLEAAISPHFELVDERDADDAMTEAREAVLARADSPEVLAALDGLAGLTTADGFGTLVRRLGEDSERLARALRLGPDLARAQRRVLGVTAHSETELLDAAVSWLGEGALRDAARMVAARASPKRAQRAAAMLDWLGQGPDQRRATWSDWCTLLLSAKGEALAPTSYVNARLHADNADLALQFLNEADRILRIEDARRALALATVSAALTTLAGPVAEGYAQRKDAAGLLDYNDLIDRTRALLVDPGAAWVLYKLDGGLDHLLLDEVQDTAPQQWRIAHALTEEFFAGTGARDTVRTVFAVGDRKQSIYSFQGADTAEFDRSRTLLERRARTADQLWVDGALDVSFRSTAPVLALVDAVFADPLARPGVVADGETLTHYADRAAHAGVVELWPLAPQPEPPPHEPWTVPQRNQTQTSARAALAEALADWIRDRTAGTELLESKGRPLGAGDVLVLVRRRDAFARALVRSLKARGVPVAGLDRMVLTEQPAVQDLMALCDALLLPGDDLSLACLLTSPLGGLSDEDLLDLAAERHGTLWDALRNHADERPAWREAADFFACLLGRVDYVTPFVLLAEALGPLGGRARLFARLGPEAAEPVDELLNAALAYAGLHPPSLQGFLHWLRRSGAEVKREAEAVGTQVRIMTVHGAKGLQAPLVIVPDTTALPQEERGIFWADDAATGHAVPLWAPNGDFRCAAFDRLRQAARQRQVEEHNRLLYVALTRAEDRLLVCGWANRRDTPDTSWYRAVERGFRGLPAEREAHPRWDGEVLRLRSVQQAEPDRVAVRDETVAEPPPPWMGMAPDWRPAAPPPEPPRPVPLAPSRPEGMASGPVPPAESPLADRDAVPDRFRRGQLIHTLLQHLPDLPDAARRDAALSFLRRPDTGLSEAEAVAAAEEVLAILTHAELAPVFGPGSRAEVPLTGLVGNAVIGGLVDRLVIRPDRVLVADFKTNRRPPVTAAETPVLYLRQMASYRAVLRGLFPDRPVRCVLIWTRSGTVSMLPDALLDAYEPNRSEPDRYEPNR